MVSITFVSVDRKAPFTVSTISQHLSCMWGAFERKWGLGERVRMVDVRRNIDSFKRVKTIHRYAHEMLTRSLYRVEEIKLEIANRDTFPTFLFRWMRFNAIFPWGWSSGYRRVYMHVCVCVSIIETPNEFWKIVFAIVLRLRVIKLLCIYVYM